MPEPGFLRAVEVLADALLTPQEFARHKPSPDQMTLRWVTIHPHGDGEEGRRIQINTETGEIEKGFGAGKTMHEAFSPKGETLATSETQSSTPGRKWYGMTYRPPALGAIPKGEYEHKPHPDFRHGQISYNEPLSQEMQDAYELTPIHEDGDIPAVAKSVGAAMGKYAGEYAKPENAQLLDNQLSLERIRKLLGHVDKDKLKAEFRKQFGQPEESAPEPQKPDDAILSKYPSLAEPPKQAAAEEESPETPANPVVDTESLRVHQQMYRDNIATLKAQGKPIPQKWLDGLADVTDKLEGKTPEQGLIASNEVFGHPSATTDPKYQNLIPIRVGDVESIERKRSQAQSLLDELQTKIGKATAVSGGKVSATAKQKKEAAAYLGSMSGYEDRNNIDALRNETLPELARLQREIENPSTRASGGGGQAATYANFGGNKPESPSLPPEIAAKYPSLAETPKEPESAKDRAWKGHLDEKPLGYKQFIAAGNSDRDWEAYSGEVNARSREKHQSDFISKWKSGEKLNGNDVAMHLKNKGVELPPDVSRALQDDDTTITATSVSGRGMSKSEAAKIHRAVNGAMTNLHGVADAGQVSPSSEKSKKESWQMRRDDFVDSELDKAANDPSHPEYAVMKSMSSAGKFPKWKDDLRKKLSSQWDQSRDNAISAGKLNSDKPGLTEGTKKRWSAFVAKEFGGNESKAKSQGWEPEDFSDEPAPMPSEKENADGIRAAAIAGAKDTLASLKKKNVNGSKDNDIKSLLSYFPSLAEPESPSPKDERKPFKPEEKYPSLADAPEKSGHVSPSPEKSAVPTTMKEALNRSTVVLGGGKGYVEMPEDRQELVKKVSAAKSRAEVESLIGKDAADSYYRWRIGGSTPVTSLTNAMKWKQHDAPPSQAEEKNPFKPEGVPGEQMGLFDQDAGGQKSLFNVVKPDKKSKKTPAAAPSELEKIGDEHKARSEESAPLPGQKSIEDQYPSLKGFVPPTINSELDAMSAEQEAERLRRSGDSEKADAIMDAVRSYDTRNPQAPQDKEKEDALRAREKERKSLERAEKKANGKGAWLPPPIKAELQLRNQKRREKFEAQWSDDWKPENHVKIAADDISKLRKQDVYRLMENATGDRRAKMADYIRQNRPELAGEVQDSLDDLGGDSNASEPKAAPQSLASLRTAMKSKIAELEAKEASETKRLTAEKSRAKGAAKKAAIDDQWHAMKEDLSKQRQAVMQSHLKEIESHPEYQQEKAESSRKAKERQAASQAEDAARANDGDKANWEHIQKNGGYEAVRDSLSADIKSLKSRLAKTKDANKWKLESNLASRERDLERVNALNEKFGSKQFSRKAPHEELIHHLHEAMNHDGKCCYEKEEGEDDIADHVPADHRHMDKAVHELCRHLGASRPELQAAYENYTAAVE